MRAIVLTRMVSAFGGLALLALLVAAPPAGAQTSPPAALAQSAAGPIRVVAAENEYADVASQIGGQYVSVQAIMSDPNTDPHTFESSPQVAQEVSAAQLTIQNGVGYDDFMTDILKASANPNVQVINVQQLLGLPDATPNPHLWYDPGTMPAVAQQIAQDLSTINPDQQAYFMANAAAFTASLAPWTQAIDNLRASYPNAPVATTEPVADYMLQAAGINNMTPYSLQTAIMNGTDPAPQDLSVQNNLFTEHQIKALVYNQQVTDDVTNGFLTLAQQNKIPVVGVYETMPTDGYNYQSWMLAEVQALTNAIANGTSAPKL
jgi:zinc/manganese transport system substrate-binding protein